MRKEGKGGGVETWVKPRHHQTAGGGGWLECDQEKRGQEEGMGRKEGGGFRVMMPRRLIEWVDAPGGARVAGSWFVVRSSGRSRGSTSNTSSASTAAGN